MSAWPELGFGARRYQGRRVASPPSRWPSPLAPEPPGRSSPRPGAAQGSVRGSLSTVARCAFPSLTCRSYSSPERFLHHRHHRRRRRHCRRPCKTLPLIIVLTETNNEGYEKKTNEKENTKQNEKSSLQTKQKGRKKKAVVRADHLACV